MTSPQKQLALKAPDPSKLRFSVECDEEDRSGGLGEGEWLDQADDDSPWEAYSERAAEVAGPVPGADFWPERRFSAGRLTKLNPLGQRKRSGTRPDGDPRDDIPAVTASIPSAGPAETWIPEAVPADPPPAQPTPPPTAELPAVGGARIPRPPSILGSYEPTVQQRQAPALRSNDGQSKLARRVAQGSLVVLVGAAAIITGVLVMSGDPSDSAIQAGFSEQSGASPEGATFDNASLRAPAAELGSAAPETAGGVSAAPSPSTARGSTGPDVTVAPNASSTAAARSTAEAPTTTEASATTPSTEPSTTSSTDAPTTSTTAAATVTTAGASTSPPPAPTTQATVATTTPTVPTSAAPTTRPPTTPQPTTSISQPTTSTTDDTTTSGASATTGDDTTTTTGITSTSPSSSSPGSGGNLTIT